MLQSEVYQIRVHGIFESAHFLYDYYPDGTDEELHGHTWEAEVFVKNGTLKNGISVDFLELRKHFESLMGDLDHTCLNDHPDFKGVNPTAENIAKYIYTQLKPSLSKPAFISEVRVWEGPKNYASYFPGFPPSPSPDGKT